MVPFHADEDYVFVVDTDKYAGNFERQMCAYMTGSYGECRVGEKEADIFEKEMKASSLDVFDGDLIQQKHDEHGCYRPATIIHSPDSHQYNSVGIFMSDKPNAEEVALLVSRAHKFVDEHLQYSDPALKIHILGFRFLVKKTIVDTESKWDANGICLPNSENS